MKIRKFKIKIQNPNQSPMKSALSSFTTAWKAAERMKLHESPYDLVISFPDISWLSKIFSPERVRIIMTIKNKKPESIYQLAKLLDRSSANVKKDVDELADLGILDLKKIRTKDQKRDALQPEYNWDGFDIAV